MEHLYPAMKMTTPVSHISCTFCQKLQKLNSVPKTRESNNIENCMQYPEHKWLKSVLRFASQQVFRIQFQAHTTI
jgi:hypothetical protein